MALRVGRSDGIMLASVPAANILSYFATNKLSRAVHHEVLTDDIVVDSGQLRAMAPQLN